MTPNVNVEAQQAEAERQWLVHETHRRLSALLGYLSMQLQKDLNISGLKQEGHHGKQLYFEDLDRITQARQEHIHPRNADGVRRPLAACRRKDKPHECKHGFMKDHLIASQPRPLCRELAERCSLPSKGRRNAVGSIEPSRNSGSINGTVPAIAVATGDNNDNEIPYRLPITEQTHEASCDGNCHNEQSLEDIALVVESSQAAQVGYHCDYCCKGQPVGAAEGKEWSKGHATLREQCQGESVAYCSRRHAQRIISDCFAWCSAYTERNSETY